MPWNINEGWYGNSGLWVTFLLKFNQELTVDRSQH